MADLLQAKTLVIQKYKLVRHKARPVVVSTILYMGRSKFLRKAGVLALAPFPTLIQRIRGLAVVSIEQKQIEGILLEIDTLVPESATKVIDLPPGLLGPNAALLRRRIDTVLAPVRVEHA